MKGENERIVAGDKRKVNALVTLLTLSKGKNCVKLLHIIIKIIKEVETDNIITQFNVGYIS